MRKRRVYLGLLLLVIAVVVWAIVVPRNQEGEPEYGGKRLSEWVLELPANTSGDGESAAEQAIRRFGNNSFPYLLKWISYEPAAWRLKVYETVSRFLRKGPNALFQDKQMLLAAGAAKALAALGPGADATKSALLRMVNDPKRGLSRVYAAFALHSERDGTAMRNPHLGGVTVTVYPGADAFSLTYQTNGAPILTVSHTNIPRALPGMLGVPGNAPPFGRTFKKSE